MDPAWKMQLLKGFAALCAGAQTPSVHGGRVCSQATTLVTHCGGDRKSVV